MGHGFQILHMILIIIFILTSYRCTHILILKPSFIFNAAKVHSNDDHKPFIFEKFRLLLGLKSFHITTPTHAYLPTPAPAPAPGPTFAPASLVHHRPAGHRYRRPLPFKHAIKKNDQGNSRVLTAVLVSVGVTSLIVLCLLYWGYRNFGERRRGGSKRTITVFSNEVKSKYMSAQSSVKKVTSDPGPDLFYLDSLETALDCSKIELSATNIVMQESGTNEDDRFLTVGEIECESDGCNSSSYGEKVVITEEEVKFITEGGNSNSSDDESFHSICDSHSSNDRLSNASSSSLNDTNIDNNTIQSIHSNSQPPLPPAATQTSPPPPPPPPPPPLPLACRPKGNIDSLKVPPPPPPQLAQCTPLGKDGAPLAKLKPLHWDKVRAAPNRSTVWDKLRTSSFEFDEEMIESLFGYNLQNTMKNEEVKSKTPSPTKHVLEPKRLQNITILSKALNVSTEQVCLALIQGEGLSLQDLEALAKMVPTDEEEAKLANFKGDINELGSAEKLVKAMLIVPFAFLRIEAMLYRETFEDEVLHLRKSFSMIEEACKELRSSRLFLKLLEAVLKTGNRMNIGTIRGGATAFKLDALLKLADVKGTDGKTTLLHFVVQEIIRSEGFRVSESIMGKINQRSKSSKIEDKEESYRRMGLDLVSGLSTELCNVKKIATTDLDVLASSVSNLSDGMSKIQQLLHKIVKTESENGNFVNSMRSFLKYGEMKLKELQEDENGVLLHVKQMTEYFHGDVSKDESNLLRIFVIVRDFLNMLDNVCKELRSSKMPRSPNPLAPFR